MSSFLEIFPYPHRETEQQTKQAVREEATPNFQLAFPLEEAGKHWLITTAPFEVATNLPNFDPVGVIGSRFWVHSES